jgi:hypothetical protein
MQPASGRWWVDQGGQGLFAGTGQSGRTRRPTPRTGHFFIAWVWPGTQDECPKLSTSDSSVPPLLILCAHPDVGIGRWPAFAEKAGSMKRIADCSYGQFTPGKWGFGILFLWLGLLTLASCQNIAYREPWRVSGIFAAEELPPPDNRLRQDRLVAQIKKAGGKVVLSPPAGAGSVVAIDLHNTGTNDADLDQLQAFSNLRTLNLYGTDITDMGLQHLESLTKLQTLHLSNTAITDAGLPHLQKLVELRELGLYHTHVTDRGLPYLASLKGLAILSLSGNQITDEGLAQLKVMRNLRHLQLNDTRATRKGLDELRQALPNLELLLDK